MMHELAWNSSKQKKKEEKDTKRLSVDTADWREKKGTSTHSEREFDYPGGLNVRQV